MMSEKSKLNQTALKELASSGEAQKLVDLLKQNGSVKDAATAASKGDSSALMGMLQQVMNSQEGATLIENIQQKAKDAGLE
ncbi:MAG: hypothetical protein R3Y63_00705 [Eubacteriales bacterium]